MASARPAHLYVIADGSGAHKVGLSVSPEKRLRRLQSASARRLVLVRQTDAPTAAASEIEAYAHWLLRKACAGGEWFNVTEEAAWVALVAAADAVARGERAPIRIAGPGRPMLTRGAATVKTTIRLPTSLHERMEEVAGEGKVAAFIRAAVEEKLEREPKPPARKPSP